jgi:hypothetical protein
MNTASRLIASTKLGAVAIGALALASGCAVPIHSRPYEPGEPVSGFVYHLARAKVVATVDVRLESCDPPQVVVLPPAVASTPAADPGKGSSFVVDPSDSWNVFKSVSGAQIQLTDDGRLGKAKAQTKDVTLPLLGEIAKLAVPGLKPAKAAVTEDKDIRPPEQKKKTLACQPQAAQLVAKLHELRDTRASLLRHELQFISNSAFKKGDDDALKTYADSLAQLNSRIDGIEKALTKSVQLNITPAAMDRKGPSKETRVDLLHGWFQASEPNEIGCRDGDAKQKAQDGFQCLNVNAVIKAASEATPAPITSDLNVSGYPGVLYRTPAAGVVTITVTRKDDDKAEPDIGVIVKSNDPMSTLQSENWYVTKGSPLESTHPVRIPQWGAISGLRSDLGPLSSNGVEIDFDEWSVPKTVSWNAEAGGLAGLLGLGSQVQEARQKADAPADPAAALRSELNLRLLQTCIDAPAASIPSYCSGLTK